MPGPLEGLRVLELAHERTAFAGKLLADAGDQLASELASARRVEIERDAAFARVVVPEGEAGFGIGPIAHERCMAALRAAVARLEQAHVRARVGEQLAGESRALVRELQHA